MDFAYWRKCDFQIHSPRDPNWTGTRPIGVAQDLGGSPATSADVDRQRNEWAETFVERCIERGLEAIALTDHHEMIMVPYVQNAIVARKAADQDFDLWFFPGMELTARNGLQCLIIFDADLSEDWRREAQGRLGIVVADLEDKAHQSPKVTQLALSYPEIGPLLDATEGLRGKYIVLPNVSQGGQHTVLTGGAHADFRNMPYVGGYLDRGQTIATLHSTNRKRLSGRDALWGDRFIYPLPTSDSRSTDYSNLGTNNCWIKLAAPTAEALRQAFLGHQSRISIVRPQIASLSVASVKIAGSTILHGADLQLSPELNSFIGGRGSGKSTYLEYIAFGLGRSCIDISKPVYSGSERLIALMKDTLIAPGGSVQLRVIQDGAPFQITRSGGNTYQPQITYPDGSVQELSLKELRSLFPAVVYSQGELSEVGKQAGKRAKLSDLLQFVEPEFKREDERLAADIEAAKLEVRAALQALSAAWAKQSQLHKLNTSRSSLAQRIMAQQKTLPALSPDDQKIVARYDTLASFDAKRMQAEKQVATVMDDLTGLWRTSRQPADLTSDAPESTGIRSAYEAFNAAFKVGVEELGTDLGRHRDELLLASAEMTRALDEAKAARDKIMEKLVEHRAATGQISNLQTELQAILAQIGQLQIAIDSPDDKFNELQRCIEALKLAVAARAKKTQSWAKQIESLSGGRIQAQLNIEGDWTEIRDAVETLSAKTGSQEATRQKLLNEQIEGSGAWSYLDALRSDSLAALRWKQIGSSLAGERPTCETLGGTLGGTDRTLATCIDLIDLPRTEAVATASPSPDITLFYCDADRKISFEKASEGQRAAALLFMLLEQPGGPLIVDQPEGDLDNKVVSSLADGLHQAKQRRQIIFASHNANIVVNGSSELVVSMDVADDGKRDIKCAGAIDRSQVCEAITETMEGGEKAFRDRKNKYGY